MSRWKPISKHATATKAATSKCDGGSFAIAFFIFTASLTRVAHAKPNEAPLNVIPNSRETQLLPIDSVKPYDRKLRRHDRRKVTKLKKLIGHFGQVAPIIIDADRVIIDGHAVWLAMRELGSGDIATITVAGRTDPEIKALRLALNRLSEEAAWNNADLRAEFEDLINLSFDMGLTAFDTAEIDHVLELDLPNANVVEDDEQIPAVQEQAVSMLGDIWNCGDHRLGCGNAHDGDFVARRFSVLRKHRRPPQASTLAEGLVDAAAGKLGMDPPF
jgi:hypothetical protein